MSEYYALNRYADQAREDENYYPGHPKHRRTESIKNPELPQKFASPSERNTGGGGIPGLHPDDEHGRQAEEHRYVNPEENTGGQNDRYVDPGYTGRPRKSVSYRSEIDGNKIRRGDSIHDGPSHETDLPVARDLRDALSEPRHDSQVAKGNQPAARADHVPERPDGKDYEPEKFAGHTDQDDADDDEFDDYSDKPKPNPKPMDPLSKARYASPEEETVHHDMDKFKHGELHSGSKHGPVVTSRKQAMAIALNQQRQKNEEHYAAREAARHALSRYAAEAKHYESPSRFGSWFPGEPRFNSPRVDGYEADKHSDQHDSAFESHVGPVDKLDAAFNKHSGNWPVDPNMPKNRHAGPGNLMPHDKMHFNEPHMVPDFVSQQHRNTIRGTQEHPFHIRNAAGYQAQYHALARYAAEAAHYERPTKYAPPVTGGPGNWSQGGSPVNSPYTGMGGTTPGSQHPLPSGWSAQDYYDWTVGGGPSLTGEGGNVIDPARPATGPHAVAQSVPEIDAENNDILAHATKPAIGKPKPGNVGGGSIATAKPTITGGGIFGSPNSGAFSRPVSSLDQSTVSGGSPGASNTGIGLNIGQNKPGGGFNAGSSKGFGGGFGR
jgi:hypothetical protein